MNHIEKSYVKVLQKRLNFLTKRIEENPDKDLSYDKHERLALAWALEVIELFAEQQAIKS